MSGEPKQTSDLQAKLREAIAEYLPAETSGLLRERLDALVKLEEERPGLEERLAVLTEANGRLVDSNAQWRNKERTLELIKEALGERETACTEREEKCRHREEVIDLKEAHAKERVDEMRSVVHDVFGNNRFKYDRTVMGPVPVAGHPGQLADPSYGGCTTPPQSGHVETHPTTEHVEGEGDVPPQA